MKKLIKKFLNNLAIKRRIKRRLKAIKKIRKEWKYNKNPRRRFNKSKLIFGKLSKQLH